MKQVYLGIETSGIHTGVALVDEANTLYETGCISNRGHNETLLNLIDEALNRTGVQLKELTGIGLTTGPGMFTALRVGLSVAKGLGLTRAIPLKGVNTLQALAATAEDRESPVLTVIDARKQQLYAALYHSGAPLIPPQLTVPEQLPRLIENSIVPLKTFRVAGDATRIAAAVLERAGIKFQPTPIAYPSPSTVAHLARKLLQKEGPDPVEHLEPQYLKKTDAELKREEKPDTSRH